MNKAELKPQEENARDLDPNVRQRRASNPVQSVWVGASAGTGKTKVLTDRVLRLLLPQENGQQGTEPGRILCLTFTKAAASEMLERVNKILSHWSVADDETLMKDLTGLTGHPPNKEQIQAARRLFARVIDTPGGLKIMTIHSFCQSILGRFPLEAELSPQFKVIDESQSTELLSKARDKVLAKAKAQPDSDIGQSVRMIAALQNEEQFGHLLSNLCGERKQLAAALQSGALRETICTMGNLSPDMTIGCLLKQACDENSFDKDALYNTCRALAAGSKTDQERGLAIQLWLDADATQKARTLNTYKKQFLTNEGAIRARLATKAAITALPDIVDILSAEAQRLIVLNDAQKTLQCADQTGHLMHIGQAILKDYAALKHHGGFLDYDDLVLETLSLLDDKDMASWVLFKLDGGLDHILVDEAQDTNPEQWKIIEKLSDEFFSGLGRHDDAIRTIFTVGDEKQSIYSFQRAAPQEFEKMRLHFKEKAKTHEEKLAISFRSVQTVLDLVDETFRPPHLREGLGHDEIKHHSFRKGQAGLVELWPLCSPDEEEPPAPWEPPTRIIESASGQAKLAASIAEKIDHWLKSEETIESLGRPLHAGDIMVLVRTRTTFVSQLVRALKLRSIPVSGVDRMILGDQIAVQDLLTFAQFALLPQDDLSLACCLKSPLIGLTDDDLFDLCYGRQGTLWDAFKSSKYKDTIAWLENLINRAASKHPFEFFAALLQSPCPADDNSGLKAMTARLGEDVIDPLDEFINASMHYEQNHIPTLQGFLLWQKQNDVTIKRELEGAGKAVRIMTVHGAKGLQAPIVILPDTTRSPSSKKIGNLLWPDKTGLDIPLWAARSDDFPPFFIQARSTLESHLEEEYRRLLYVAMTRAEDRLYVCGYRGKKEPIEECWYNYIAEAFTRLPDLEETESGVKRITRPQTKEPDRFKDKQDNMSTPRLGAPSWLHRRAPAEPFPPRPLVPSRPSEPEPAMRSPLDSTEEHRFKRGNITHKLLAILPELPASERRKAAEFFVARPAHDLSESLQADIVKETMAILEHHDYGPIFGENSMAEVPITGLMNGRLISAQIDRLLITDTEIMVIDFKSNRPPPQNPANVPQIYRDQLTAYRDIIAAIHPGKPIRCFLLWTDGPDLMEINDL